MASARGHDHSARLIESACCECPTSDEKMNKQCSPYFESTVSKFEERRGDLVNRQQYLRQKITTMERSIPALIAFNMLKTDQNHDDTPLCRVKEIMNKLSPHCDPTDKLLDKLRNTVKSLNGETAELHDKIIAADITLEESEMELESLELANEELEGRVRSLESELKKHETPSLHSIYSEDLVCLSKIRQLGEAEVNLKNSIKELEEREILFHRQMDRIFKSKEFKEASCGGINKKIRQLECNERKMHCALHAQKCNVQQLKKKLMRNEMELASANDVENPTTEKFGKETNPSKVSNQLSNVTFNQDNMIDNHDAKEKSHQLSQKCKNYEENSLVNCICPNPALTACYDESSCPVKSRAHLSSNLQTTCNTPPFCRTCNYPKCPQPSVSSIRACCVSLTSKPNESSRGQACKESSIHLKPHCKIANNLPLINLKSCKGNSSYKASSKSKGMPICASQAVQKKIAVPSDGTRDCDPSERQEPTLCNLGTLCTKCQGLKICKQQSPIDCRCSCKGKCATGEPGVPCNCEEYLSSVDKEDNQQSGDSIKINDHSSTDEEYCECCDCGNDDSDVSDTVHC